MAVTRPAHGAGASMRAHGGRATPARRLLLRALVENPGHSSAEELAAAVHARGPTSINRPSTATSMSWNGSTSSTAPASAGASRPTTWPQPPHGHLVCERCSSMTEVPDEISPASPKQPGPATDPPASRTASPLPACAPTASDDRTDSGTRRQINRVGTSHSFLRTDRTVPGYGVHIGHPAGR